MDRYDSRYQRVESCVNFGFNVYKAKDKHTNDFVVVKRIRLEIEDEGIPITTLREISVLRQLKHPNIVELSDVIQSEGRLFLVFEFVDKDLKKYFEACEGPLSQQLIKSYCHQMLSGLHFCHVRGVMHRDLKPQNVLISRNGQLKLASFGLARSFVPSIRHFTHEVVHLWYRPPEILLGCKTYALPVDVWAIGTILAEMVTKIPLFPGDSEIDEIFKIFRVLGTPNNDIWPGVSALPDWNEDFPVWPSLHLSRFVPGLSVFGIDILERMISLDPRRRITCKEALAHPYFADFVVDEM